MIYRFLLVIFSYFVLSIGCVKAQHWLGLSSSNYAGTNALYLNPAHAADSRFKTYINVVGNDFFIINNYLGYTAPYSFFGLITNTVSNKYRSERGLIIWKDSYYDEKLNGKPKNLYMGGDLRGPSFQYAFNQNRMALALTTRGRYLGSFTDVTEPLARLVRYGTDLKELQKTPFTAQQGTLNTNVFVELGLTFGAVLIDNEEDFWKVGVTAKRLVGLYNMHAQIQNADYIVDIESFNPEREFILVSQLQGTYGYTTEEAYTNFKPTPQWLFGKQSAGSGWGFDVGVVYEYRPDAHKFKRTMPRGGRQPDPNQNKYKFRISAALTDVGAINYRNTNYVRELDVNQNQLTTFSYLNFDKVGLAGGPGAVNKTFNVSTANIARPFRVGLPTSVNVSFDYQHQKNWYINALWVQGVRGSRAFDIKPQSVLAVTPRYEKRWLEVATPVALLDNYSKLSIGLAARVGPVIVGTDHLGGLINIGTPRGLNFYFALYAPFFHRKPTDPNKCWEQPYEKKARRRK
ncbi:MAG: hypothetical protein EAZ29_08565 [Runella slithyformis]|nr:MAG: hypothetical protein EAZ29_08565 [Runella slithyformis]